MAFNTDSAVSEFKEQLKSKDAKINELHGQLGKYTNELEWTEKKLQSLEYETIWFTEYQEAVLVINVLNDALKKYGIPDIFNTDQGSQYIFHEHTELLIKNNIKISMDGN